MARLEQLRSLTSASREVATVSPPRGGRHAVWVFVLLPMAIAALFLYVNRGWLRPAVAVSGARALATKVSASDLVSHSSDQVLFQASGWIEPEPYPVKATSFVEGVVVAVRILDGQFVQRGEVLAELDDRNLRLAMAEIEAEVAAMSGDLLVLGERIGEAERQIALAAERLATAEAEWARLQRQAEILQRAGEAVPLIQREDARLAVERQRNSVQEAVRERELREAMLRVVRAEEDAQRHKVAGRQATLDKLRLDLERTVIRAPLTGMIQQVQVRVGQMVQPGSDTMDAATIATLYDPARLQVRVDVALADAARLTVGMPALIVTEVLSGVRLPGLVTSIAGQADLAKNTLQAKVKLIDPHVSLRPEMLARVEFLPAPAPGDSDSGEKLAMVHALVPEMALFSLVDRRAKVWVAAREGTVAELREVTLGEVRGSGWREVRAGVNPGEIVLLSDHAKLTPGRRVKVAIAAPPASAANRGDIP